VCLYKSKKLGHIKHALLLIRRKKLFQECCLGFRFLHFPFSHKKWIFVPLEDGEEETRSVGGVVREKQKSLDVIWRDFF
jgi:hypothetical protein